jgi:glycosyltransferase involved in cell wall biosynthesis
MHGLDVLVVPSTWYEISPLVILEAFAHGVPVVGADLRNLNSQVRHGVNGLLFRSGDAGDLARQLQRLVDEPDLLPTLAEGISPPCTVEEEVQEVERVYASIVRSGQPASA